MHVNMNDSLFTGFQSGCEDLRCKTNASFWLCCPLILLNPGRQCTLACTGKHLPWPCWILTSYKQSQATLTYFNETYLLDCDCMTTAKHCKIFPSTQMGQCKDLVFFFTMDVFQQQDKARVKGVFWFRSKPESVQLQHWCKQTSS